VKARVWIPLVLVVLLGIGAWQLSQWRNQPPTVNFVKATREDISSLVSTNGKVEPVESAIARAETSGVVTKILVQLRQNVTNGMPLVEVDSGQARGDVEAAEAKIAQIQTELSVVDRGGRSTDQARIQGEIEAATLAAQQAKQQFDIETRLEAKQATTKMQVREAKDVLDRAELQLKTLREQKAALVAPSDRNSIQAQLQGAQVAKQQAEMRIKMSTVLAPIDGTVYEFDLKPGAYLNPGDVVATIGKLDTVHVNVFVDEPDLGRVAKGKPVTITWNALPGRKWTGVVDRMPLKIVSQGSRQVGEVVCVIQNPDKDLLVGTNVDVVILSETAEKAITIPKNAVFHENGQTGVYLRSGDRLKWKVITEGINNVTKLQAKELQEGDEVALPGDKPLSDGMIVGK
jgi:HlyD family secretion protein